MREGKLHGGAEGEDKVLSQEACRVGEEEIGGIEAGEGEKAEDECGGYESHEIG